MPTLRSFITPWLVLAVAVAPAWCCCTAVSAAASAASAQATAGQSAHPVSSGHCSSESAPAVPGDCDTVPDGSQHCDCDRTLIADTSPVALKLAPAVELPVLPWLPAVASLGTLAPLSPYTSAPSSVAEPPGLAARQRLALLCVLRL